jgi:hypothetical protein
MAIDHDISGVMGSELCGCRTSNFMPVTDMDAQAIDVHENLLRQLRVVGRISIAKNRPDRRDQA